MRWSIARRITLGYAAVLLLLAVVGLVATYALSGTGTALQDVIRREELLDAAMEARGDTRAILDAWDGAAKAAIVARRAGRDAEARRITVERVLPARDRWQPMIREGIGRERARTPA